MSFYRIQYVLFNLKNRRYLPQQNKQKYIVNKTNQIIKRKIHTLLPNGSNEPDPKILIMIMGAISYYLLDWWYYKK
jgi:hypothetical protein